jgi:hypothetical protein
MYICLGMHMHMCAHIHSPTQSTFVLLSHEHSFIAASAHNPTLRSVLTARESVYSDAFLVGTVPGWGTYEFQIELQVSKTSPDVGLFLNHFKNDTLIAYFPLAIRGSYVSVLHGDEVIASANFSSVDNRITKAGCGRGLPAALKYKELKAMLSAKDSVDELTVNATVVLPHIHPLISSD